MSPTPMRLVGISPTMRDSDRKPLGFLSARKQGNLPFEEKSNFIITAFDLPLTKKLAETHPLTELHDQIIVATALLYDAKVLTKDGEIRDSGLVETVW